MTQERLELRQAGENAPGPIFVDFTAGKAAYRRMHGGGRKEALVRAIGIKGKTKPHVLDATGGLGRDAFVIASQGCRVTIVEKNPVIFALLEDGLTRAANDPDIGGMVKERMLLIKGNSLDLLAKLAEDDRPDVVYLDPMYPHRNKSAKAKKEMQILRALIGEDTGSEKLLAASLKTALKRVVIKRPSYAPNIGEIGPDLVYKTRKNRFDVYLT